LCSLMIRQHSSYPAHGLSRCRPKPRLEERPLLTLEAAAALVEVYETLASDTRLRILHALVRSGEACPIDLAAQLGMKPAAISNQLQRLADRSIIGSRREGNRVFYRIVDPCVIELIDRGLCLLEDSTAARTAAIA